MERMISAKLNQGIDSFLRVTMTLRRKEVDIKAISMTNNQMNDKGIKIILDENITSIDKVINHMKKLHDVEEIVVH